MTWLLLLAWVNDPTRSLPELRAACSGLGLTPTGNRGQLLSKLRNRISPEVTTNPDAPSPWSPAGWTPPVPTPPAPAPTPAPADNRDWLWPLVAALAIVAGLILFLAWSPWDDGDDNSNGFVPTETPAPTAPPNTMAPPATNPPTAPQPTSPPQTAPDTTIQVAPDSPTAADMACRLEKDGTWSEGNNPHRIEVAGHGVRHNDYYPQVGVKSISYIVDEILPLEVSPIWWGYGSQWSGDSPECQSFDWIADASAYAAARVDSGHSGLVVDLRNGTFEVVYNASNMSQSDIDALLAAHLVAMN